jgi:hypothetical protein
VETHVEAQHPVEASTRRGAIVSRGVSEGGDSSGGEKQSTTVPKPPSGFEK